MSDDYFQYRGDVFHAEEVDLNVIAKQFGTPSYVYSRRALEDTWHAFDNAFEKIPHRICYAVKANSNLAILNVLARLGSGFDIVSVGELERVIEAGGDPAKIVFSGVGKRVDEIARALDVGIFCFNVESLAELTRINTLAKAAGKMAHIALRINPNIDAQTHPYIATGMKENKFGIDIAEVLPLTRDLSKLSHVKLIGIGFHIGSQLTELQPFTDAVQCILELAAKMKAEGIEIRHLDIGGGLGVCYKNEKPPTIVAYAKTVLEKLQGHAYEILLEPGRAIVANAGVLLTRIEYLKHTPHKNFAVVDAAMNDLMRPALYHAWQNIVPVTRDPHPPSDVYDIVGPVCESADFLGKDRHLSARAGESLAICSAGAYGFTMSSNYNSRPRAAEVMIDKDKMYLVRERETIKSLYAGEKRIP